MLCARLHQDDQPHPGAPASRRSVVGKPPVEVGAGGVRVLRSLESNRSRRGRRMSRPQRPRAKADRDQQPEPTKDRRQDDRARWDACCPRPLPVGMSAPVGPDRFGRLDLRGRPPSPHRRCRPPRAGLNERASRGFREDAGGRVAICGRLRERVLDDRVELDR